VKLGVDVSQISAAARCAELIGKHRGMFVARTALQWDLDPRKMTYEQLDVMAQHFLKQMVGDDPVLYEQAVKELEAGTLVVEYIPEAAPSADKSDRRAVAFAFTRARAEERALGAMMERFLKFEKVRNCPNSAG
jgi:hypothetical protein